TRLLVMIGRLLCLGAIACRLVTPRDGCTVRLGPRHDLQQAIDRIPDGERPARICLDAGEFRLQRFLSIRRDDVTLEGEGPATVLRVDDGVESPVVVIGDYE